MMENIVPLHIFQIKKDLFKSMQPILRYSKNNKQLFWMVPKWLTRYLANYVINKWSTAFGPISNPSVFEVLYLVKYFGDFRYFISHDIKNRFKNAVTLTIDVRSLFLMMEARTSQWLYCKGRWPNEKIYLAGVIIFENCNNWIILWSLYWVILGSICVYLYSEIVDSASYIFIQVWFCYWYFIFTLLNFIESMQNGENLKA